MYRVIRNPEGKRIDWFVPQQAERQRLSNYRRGIQQWTAAIIEELFTAEQLGAGPTRA